MNQVLEKNIPKIYTLKFFAMALVLMPVIVPFFQSMNIGMKGVYLLQSSFAITVFICEIPSGYISDLMGRKKTLIISSILRAIGFSIFPFATGLAELVVAEIILGVAISLSSGTDTALLYDSLEASGKSSEQMSSLGKGLSYLSLGEGLASLVASALLYFSFSIFNLVQITAVMSWIPLFVVLTLIEPKRELMDKKEHKENLRYIFNGLFKQSKLLNLIILNSVFSFSGTLFAVWLFQKYWTDLNIAIVYFGVFWALTNFAVSISSLYTTKLEKMFGSYSLLILVGLLPIMGYFGISFIDQAWGFVFCLCFQVCRGIGQVILKNALNKRVTADFRATANSITQMGVRVLFTFIGPVLGLVIDKHGLSTGTFYMGWAYIAVSIFVMAPLLKERHNFLSNS